MGIRNYGKYRIYLLDLETMVGQIAIPGMPNVEEEIVVELSLVGHYPIQVGIHRYWNEENRRKFISLYCFLLNEN